MRPPCGGPVQLVWPFDCEPFVPKTNVRSAALGCRHVRICHLKTFTSATAEEGEGEPLNLNVILHNAASPQSEEAQCLGPCDPSYHLHAPLQQSTVRCQHLSLECGHSSGGSHGKTSNSCPSSSYRPGWVLATLGSLRLPSLW